MKIEERLIVCLPKCQVMQLWTGTVNFISKFASNTPPYVLKPDLKSSSRESLCYKYEQQTRLVFNNELCFIKARFKSLLKKCSLWMQIVLLYSVQQKLSWYLYVPYFPLPIPAKLVALPVVPTRSRKAQNLQSKAGMH